MRILLRRNSGHGDILCLTSVIPGLRARYPDAEIHFQTGSGYADLVLGHPEIHQVWETANDVAAETLEHFDIVYEPDHGLHWNDAICKVQCRLLGVHFSPPRIYLDEDEIMAAPESDVCVVNHTCSDRTYPRMKDVVPYLHNWGWRTLQIDNGPNLGCEQPKLTMRQAAAAIARTRLLLTVDTGAMHVGVALRKPLVVIFGALTGTHNQYVPDAWLATTADAPDLLAGFVTRRLKNMAVQDGRQFTDLDGMIHTA